MRYIILILLFTPLSLLSQDDCGAVSDKKIEKLLAKAKNSKYKLGERVHFLREAVDIDEDCVACHYQLGVKLYRKAKATGVSYQPAIEALNTVKAMCPDYHSDVYFYLGVMYYSMENWEAAKEEFERHQVASEDSRARDFIKKQEDIEDVLLELGFKIGMQAQQGDIVKTKVKGVSSAVDEYLPALSLDNETMFYTRQFEKKAKGDIIPKRIEEFCSSSRAQYDDEFDAGAALPPPFNEGDNYGGATISIDNSEMYITICRPNKKGHTNCDIYYSKREKVTNPKTQKEEYQWSEFTNLGPNINTEDGWESQPSLSAEGDKLYFSTARANTKKNKTGVPGMDLFYSEKDDNGQWQPAQSLGDVLNTTSNEKSPFMHGDSKTLYFSSDRNGGVGKYDIYFTRLSSDGTWSKPTNIGSPINTEFDEHGMIVSTDGSKAYYASNRMKGAQGYDIYTFTMPQIARPEKIMLIKGEVKDTEGKAISNVSLELNYIHTKKVEKITVNQEGAYAKIINVQTEPVVLTISKDDYAFEARVFSKEDSEVSPVAKSEVVLEKAEVGKPYPISDLKYNTASAEISTNSQLVLDEFAKYLNAHPSIHISIHGHTDNVGDPTKNQQLSTQRAAEVMAYLVGKKVAPHRLKFKGYGATKPITTNDTEEGRAINRRTEFVIDSM